mmetsp:Transcript_27265/g.30359  ORF Transcript_27265/g.30359 Transcript_27265/m.30359 type:complete len:445 (+) Transcript_27265:68-1402(+)
MHVYICAMIVLALSSTIATPTCDKQKIGQTGCVINEQAYVPGPGWFSIEVTPKRLSALEYSFSNLVCSPTIPHCAITVALLNSTEMGLLRNNSFDVANASNKQGLIENKTNGSQSVLFSGEHETPDYSIVYVNPHNRVNITLSYNISYSIRDSCLAFFLGASGFMILLFAIIVVAVFLEMCKNKKNGKASTLVPKYKYVMPQPFEWCTCGWTIPLLQKQATGWWYYYLHNDDILWIWFPDPVEVLTRAERVVVSITFMLMYLLFSSTWGRSLKPLEQDIIGVIPDEILSSSTVIQFIVLKIVSGATLIAIIGTFYKPLLRVIKQGACISSRSNWKRCFSAVFLLIAALVLFTLFLFVAVSVFFLLDRYTCEDLLVNVLISFVLTVVTKNIIFGFPLRYLAYRIECTFGSPPQLQATMDEINLIWSETPENATALIETKEPGTTD